MLAEQGYAQHGGSIQHMRDGSLIVGAKVSYPALAQGEQLQVRPSPKISKRGAGRGEISSNSPEQSGFRPVSESGVFAKDRGATIELCWVEIQSVLQPTRLVRLCEECETRFPASEYKEQIRTIASGARRTLEIQRAIGLAGDFFDDPGGDQTFRRNLGQAIRGDSQAAYKIADAFRHGEYGVTASPRRLQQWLRFSAELGNGLASWELAEIYNYEGMVADAVYFERKAIDMGYRPPTRLPTRGY